MGAQPNTPDPSQVEAEIEAHNWHCQCEEFDPEEYRQRRANGYPASEIRFPGCWFLSRTLH